MELLKKGIVLGLGAHDMSKKQIEDFTNKLHTSKMITKEQAKELANHIMKRKLEVNEHLSSKIESLIKEQINKQELATLNHIEYLEKRIDLLEEELYNLLLEKYINEVDDDEIAKLLKELDIDKDLLDTKKGKKTKNTPLFDQDWLKSDSFENTINVDDSIAELEDLLYLPREGEVKMVKKKKAAKPAVKAKPKAKATKKKAKK